MPVLRCYPDCHVAFAVIRPAGFRILGALDRIAKTWVRDLWLTSGTDGTHSGGPEGAHGRGEAFDVRSQDCANEEEKLKLTRLLIVETCDAPDETVAMGFGGYYNRNFFAFLEVPGTANEHIHCQRRKGQVYP